jgi:1,4-alpha-glucan branching enzyme
VFGARRAELRVAAAARHGPSRALARAARELLAAQSSDWAFMTSRRTAGEYPLERARGHLAGVDEALTALPDSRAVPEPALRTLAPHLDLGPLLLP